MSSRYIQPGDPAMEGDPIETRATFPEPAERPVKPSGMDVVSSLIKSGGLTKFIAQGCWPAVMHEPLSEQQRRAQMAEWFCLLDKAAEAPKGSEERILYITAFMVASWSEPRQQMAYRPFKPLMNETFELVDPVRGFKFLAEDVLHEQESTKVVACWTVWSRRWGANFQTEPTHKLSMSGTGPYLAYDANQVSEFHFEDGDYYTAELPPGIVSSLTSKSQSWAFKGNTVVQNADTGLQCVVDMSEPGYFSGLSKHGVKGHLQRSGKKLEHVQVVGQWDAKISAVWQEKKKKTREQVLWEASRGPKNRWNMNQFAEQLNHLPKTLQQTLPPTDSRWRGELHAIETGEYTKADQEIKRLAEVKKTTADGHASQQRACWFEEGQPAPQSKLRYRYKGGYWEARAAATKGDQGAWSASPDIFGMQSKKQAAV